MKHRVLDAHLEHPEWSDKEIADYIGATDAYVRSAATRLGIRLGSRDKAISEATETRKPPEAPTQPEAPKPSPVASPAPMRDVQTKPLTRPRGARFRLRDRKSGLYLHHSLERNSDGDLIMTDLKNYPWCDSEERMRAVRKNFPETADLTEEVVES